MDTNNPNIPIVGQPARLMVWWPTVLIECLCDRAEGSVEHTFIHLTTIGIPFVCPKCRASYTVTGMLNNQPNVTHRPYTPVPQADGDGGPPDPNPEPPLEFPKRRKTH